MGGGVAVRILTSIHVPTRLSASFLALAIGLAACAAPTATTRVERGEKVSTGDEAFDTFFREVAEVKNDADKAGADATAAAKPLSDAIGPANKGTPPPEVVRAEAKKLQMGGTLLHLELVPEAKLVTSAKPDAPSEEILTAAEQAAKSSLVVARRAAEILVRVADLERRRADLLEKSKTTFTDSAKQKDVSLELVAAASVLEAARQAGEKHAGSASRLALELAVALETGAGSGAVAKKPPGKPGTRPAGTGTGTRPAGTGTGSPAKPKGDDFDR
jgi:hypothetical protein